MLFSMRTPVLPFARIWPSCRLGVLIVVVGSVVKEVDVVAGDCVCAAAAIAISQIVLNQGPAIIAGGVVAIDDDAVAVGYGAGGRPRDVLPIVEYGVARDDGLVTGVAVGTLHPSDADPAIRVRTPERVAIHRVVEDGDIVSMSRPYPRSWLIMNDVVLDGDVDRCAITRPDRDTLGVCRGLAAGVAGHFKPADRNIGRTLVHNASGVT